MNTKFKKGQVPWNKNRKGRQRNHNTSGLNSFFWLGKKRPEMSKIFKKANTGRIAWNKGLGNKTPESKKIRMSIESRLWREAIFARDNWTCQKYGTKGSKLHSHHIQNFAQYPELRFAIDNGITFSKKAHEEFHKIYGRRNNTKEQLEEFLKDN